MSWRSRPLKHLLNFCISMKMAVGATILRNSKIWTISFLAPRFLPVSSKMASSCKVEMTKVPMPCLALSTLRAASCMMAERKEVRETLRRARSWFSDGILEPTGHFPVLIIWRM